jgi:hypothetical protein
MKTQVICKCGAIYQQTVERVPSGAKGSFDCGVCGKQLDSWNGPRVPEYQLLRRPDRKRAG